MPDTLTTIISKSQALLLDDGTNYTTATCTAAARKALAEFNLHSPVHAATLIDAVNNQLVYELTGNADATNALALLDVLQQDPSGGDKDIPLPFLPYNEDERIFFQLRNNLPSGTLVVRFTLPHTVSGLDSATQSTLPAIFDPILVDGTCYHALLIRANSRVETINLNPNVSAGLFSAAQFFKQAFDAGLLWAQQKRPAMIAPTASQFDDQWHGRDY
jgi:hypothetical protein